MTPLEPGQLWVMRLNAAAFALALVIAASMGDYLLRRELGWPAGALTAPVALLALWLVLGAPGRQWRAWGYAVEPEELRVRHGVLTEVQTLVPFARVQHIDVAQGPLERAFGVSRLILHTAGTANSTVVLPGIGRARAESLRDEIRAHIRADAA